MSESFFKAILGEAATGALMKAGERSPALASALLPRAVYSWLEFASNWDYEGEVPGLPDSYMEFSKSGADSYDGFVAVGDHQYEFKGVPLLHMAASVAVALGGAKVDTSIKQSDIQALGKNIDLLVKTRYLNLMQKAEENGQEKQDSPLSVDCHTCHAGAGEPCNWAPGPAGYHRNRETHWKEQRKKQGMDKTELPGKAHAPTAPEPPNGGEPQKKAPQRQMPGQRMLSLTRSEAETPCSVCDAPQFKDGKLVLCYCMKDMKKHISEKQEGDRFVVTFDDAWSNDDIRVFCDIVRGER